MSKFSGVLLKILQSSDSWTGPDKILDLVAGFVVSLVVTVLTEDAEIGFSTGVGSAAVKVIFNTANSKKDACSFKDFTIGSLGALFGTALGRWVIHNKQLFGTLLT